MVSVVDLIKFGLTKEQAEKLLKDKNFSKKNETEANFESWLKKVAELYSTNEKKVLEIVLSFPQFAGYDHSRVLRDLQNVYGEANLGRLKMAVLSFPPFAGLDHSRVLNQALKVGKLINLSREEIIEVILDKPVLASYSLKRNVAVIQAYRNALRRLKTEDIDISGFSNKKLFEIYLKSFADSPYPVKGKRESEKKVLRRTGKTKISKAGKNIENRLRKSLRK